MTDCGQFFSSDAQCQPNCPRTFTFDSPLFVGKSGIKESLAKSQLMSSYNFLQPFSSFVFQLLLFVLHDVLYYCWTVSLTMRIVLNAKYENKEFFRGMECMHVIPVWIEKML